MRFNELITGVRADIAIKIFGDDLTYLSQKASEIKNIIKDVPGAADIIIEKTEGLPQMNIAYKRKQIARYGLNIQTLNNYLAMAFGGAISGSVFEGEKKFDLVVRLNQANRVDINNIQNLPIPIDNSHQIPMSEFADISYSEGPAKISRENTHRMVAISVNVRNKDLQSVVKAIQNRIDKNINLKPGNYIHYGGQFENLKNASKRLLFAVPLALLLIFIFLHFAFKSFKDAIMIFTAVPLSSIGGVLFLWIRGMPFSVSAGIGFIALFGIAVLNGIVLIEHLKDLQKSGMSNMRELILTGTKDRLRPVILTAAAAAAGFLPMAISTGAGAEVQRPLATVVIGGLISSSMLTMIALPLLFEIFYNVVGIRFRPLRFIRSKPVITVLVLAFSCFGIQAQTKEIDLNETIELALKNNKNLKIYELRLKQEETLKASYFNPDKTRIFYEYDQNNVAENGHPLKIFGLEQNFSFPTVYSAQSKINQQKISSAELNFNHRKQLLIKDITLAYNQILYLKNKIDVLKKVDSLFSNYTKNANLKYKNGEISLLDLLNSKAKQEKTALKVKDLSHKLVIAYNKLNSITQIQTAYKIRYQKLEKIQLDEFKPKSSFTMQKAKLDIMQKELLSKLQINQTLPDISLSYYRGSNSYSNNKTYEGFQIGLSIPLFYKAHKSKIKARQIGLNMSKLKEATTLIQLNSKQKELKTELLKYQETIQYFENTGIELSNEIIRNAEKTFQLGEVDFFKFAISMENALELRTKHLDDLFRYNQVAIELNYLSK